MSILLPDIDDATAADRLHSLGESLQQLEAELEKLSSQRRILQDQQATVDQRTTGRRRSLIALPPTTWVKKSGTEPAPRDIHGTLQDIDFRLESLLQRHRRLSFSLEIYKGVLAPISRIPYEILEQIFRYTLPPGFVKPSTRQSPLLLTTVCRKWRTVALSARSLWSSISTTSDWPLRVFLPGSLPSRSDKLSRLIPRRPSVTLPSQPLLWIERARGVPFCMEITIPKKDYWFGTTDPYYHWVIQTSERWFHLRLAARSINLALLLSKPMPKLETLELVGLYDRDYDMFMLRTHEAEFNLYPHTYSFPWNSLTTLEAPETWLIVDQLVTIINGSPNLRRCRAKIQDIYTVRDARYFISSQITHPSLVSLHIFLNDRDGYPLRRLLDTLTLPSLKILKVTTLNELTRSNWPHAAFINFARRSQCPMQTLNLTGFSMFRPRTDTRWSDPSRLEEIRSSLPSLESFRFT